MQEPRATQISLPITFKQSLERLMGRVVPEAFSEKLRIFLSEDYFDKSPEQQVEGLISKRKSFRFHAMLVGFS